MITDLFQEILAAIRRNLLRTALTGFAVAWGIFMLIVLLGSGNGLLNAQQDEISSMAMNIMSVDGGFTSEAYDGMQQGRAIQLDEKDLAISASMKEHVADASATIEQGSQIISFGKEYIKESLLGVYPDYLNYSSSTLANGRFINRLDMTEFRKVCVMNQRSIDILFKDVKDPIGQFVKIGNSMMRVVGIYKDKGNMSGSTVFLPFTTLRLLYNKGDKLESLKLTLKDLNTIQDNEAFEAAYRQTIASHQHFKPDDSSALWINNHFLNLMKMNKANDYLEIAIWIIGLFTMLSGIVGVSNIMLITVKERTHEFGIRKALGAKPSSILWSVVAESIAITTLFGYIGMVAGIGVTEWMNVQAGNQVMDAGLFQATVFKNPTVGLDVAIEATLTLVIAGTLAGLFPAVKAVRTRPIEALRSE